MGAKGADDVAEGQVDRCDAEASARLAVECRRGFDPAPVRQDAAVAVVDEDVCAAHSLPQARALQMVTHIGKTQMCRYHVGAASVPVDIRPEDAHHFDI